MKKSLPSVYILTFHKEELTEEPCNYLPNKAKAKSKLKGARFQGPKISEKSEGVTIKKVQTPITSLRS